ncbi:MAG: phenylalanine--tRNA ligase subunit beta [Bacilli bacterium]|jgi:phenylalanyl-tRNA synthetase beta chain|nr:phenylalanine--tRNA ligase subunit beta [Bacilli bacterium]NLN80722.1 phenylalanine--tRNA ligase subunit beta [Erysipelotrichia bacterium]
MIVSYNWLKKYINLNNVDPFALAKKLTFAGVEVEEVKKLASATNLVIGEIVNVRKHTNSDHLHVTTVNIGKKTLQIVCGAPNCRENLKVIVALEGAKLPFGVIKKSSLRGEVSEGMICSLSELGVDHKFLSSKQLEGIEELDNDAVVGETNVLEYLGLDDYLLDLRILPNRSDLYALLNVAYEIATLENLEVKKEDYKVIQGDKSSFYVNSLTPQCPQFSARVISDIQVGPSPKWLKVALQSMNVRSINNIVDIGNYVMLLTGQPLHMYDYDKLPKKELIIKDDYVGSFIGLDEKEYQVQKGDIGITSNNEVMCLGGVFGAYSSAVDELTKKIVIEVANFSFSAIRKTANRLGLTSDASIRFMKGINPYQFESVMHLATDLILKLCKPSSIEEIITYDQRSQKEVKNIKSTYEYINNRLGTSFTSEEILKTLKRAHIKVDVLDDKSFLATPPTWRIDLVSEADLSEEVIRLIGLEHIKGSLPLLPSTLGGYTPFKNKVLRLRQYLSHRGIDEILTYSLVSKKEISDFVLLKQTKAYKLLNPLSEEHMYLRLSLIPSLLQVASYNQARDQKNLALYEISDIDYEGQEKTHLSLLLSGGLLLQDELNKTPYSFYHLKGIIEGLARYFHLSLNRLKFEKVEKTNVELHPGQSAYLKFDNQVVGYLGKLHPLMAKKYDVEKEGVYLLEIVLDDLLQSESKAIVYEQLSRFPVIKRDLSLLVPEHVTYGEIKKTITSFSKLINQVNLFDIYLDKHLPLGFKSIAISLTYLDKQKTLLDEEVKEIEKKLIELLNKKHQIILRT